MKYCAKYRWTYNTLDEDVGIIGGVAEKEFDLPLNQEEAVAEIHRQLANENPVSNRRSYELLDVTFAIDLSAAAPQGYERFTDQFRDDHPRINMDDNSWAKMDEDDSM